MTSHTITMYAVTSLGLYLGLSGCGLGSPDRIDTSTASALASESAAPASSAPPLVPRTGRTCNGVDLPCAVGDTGPGGGVIFYDAGSEQPWGRYLEAAPEGWSGSSTDPAAAWCPEGALGSLESVPSEQVLGSGPRNTSALLYACGLNSPAGIANAYRGGGLSDWYLPSRDDLNSLYELRATVGGLSDDEFWWSSSQAEFRPEAAWMQWFGQEMSNTGRSVGAGDQWEYFKVAESRVRPIRSVSSAPGSTPGEIVAAAPPVCQPGGACAVGYQGPGGGIVFYDAGTQQPWGRFLEAAPFDWSTTGSRPEAPWCPEPESGYATRLPTRDDIGSGATNTSTIVEACGPTSGAAVAARYAGGGVADWFLPAKDELAAMIAARPYGMGLERQFFWSSSQSDIDSAAWGQRAWDSDSEQADMTKSGPFWIRPIRAF